MRFDRWSLAVLLMVGVMGVSLARAQENSEEMAAPSAPAAEEAQPAEEPAVAESPAIPAAPADREMEWIWGEVVGVDGAAKEVTIKHLDYDTYEEAKTILSLDERAAYENVEGLAQIKAGDHVTADYYKVGSRNVVELLVLEKDELLTETAPGAEIPAAAPAVDVPAPAEVPVVTEPAPGSEAAPASVPVDAPIVAQPAPAETPVSSVPVDAPVAENPPVMLPSDPASAVPSVAEEVQVPAEVSSPVAPSSEASSEPPPAQ